MTGVNRRDGSASAGSSYSINFNVREHHADAFGKLRFGYDPHNASMPDLENNFPRCKSPIDSPLYG